MTSSPETGPADLLFVLLPDSGIAPDGPDTLAPLAAALQGQYPKAMALTVHPPLRDVEGRCRWWLDAEPSPGGVTAALPHLLDRLRLEARKLDLPWQRVALAGVGDGALLALEAVQAEPALVGRVLAFAGGYLARPEVAPQDVCVHLLHGLEDRRFPYHHVVDAAQALVDLGADVTADLLPHIDHGLHPALIDKAMEQLRTFIPARLWREALLAAQESERPVG
ncbi:esterase [Roseateles saccharophilus]|uniref:Phospholipase/carboxylesterase n=1 Tax=Roseateles saccharophilus TaxID=304 RepID=A0A4R3VKC2_ROSSA|nr:esterase [Roseateles saccharophilus]MDG0831164.1 esterase [Roseateles saccharophilus]TCV04284.1 phospholipase/carboxylesterase [Roseateles saccharophilus]